MKSKENRFRRKK